MKKLIAAILLVVAISQSQAQTDTLSSEPGPLMLDEMVVSASRWEQNLREVSNTITTVGRATMALSNPQTGADVLSMTPGVFVQKSQMAGGSPMIRGFATNRVLIVVDGVRMNNAIFRSGNVQNVISLDANALANTEVIFGPGAVFYGSDAIGGVMDFHTLRPAFATGDGTVISGNGMLRFSSANREKSFHADVNIGTRRWAFLTSASYSDYDELIMGRSGPVEYTRADYVARENDRDTILQSTNVNRQRPTGYNQLNLMQKVVFSPSALWKLTYNLQYSETSNYARYDRLLLRDDDGSLANAEWYYGPQKWTMHNLTALYTGEGRLSDNVRMVAAYQDYHESRHNRSFGSSRRTNRFEDVNVFSFNIDADKAIGKRTTFYYGAEWLTMPPLICACSNSKRPKPASSLPTRSWILCCCRR
jgi:hemoglobin/transferrin/lactoferrin receptor protein